MKLITSAAYISSDFVTEIGKLPPAFLPLGNRRLFEHQIRALGTDSDDLFLSLPADFEMNRQDEELLREHRVEVLRVPVGLSLGASVVFCWNSAEGDHDRLDILHGDTLLLDFPYGEPDTVSEAQNAGYYPRARLHESAQQDEDWAGDDEWVLSGYFSFADPKLLVRSIVQRGGDFIAGLRGYDERRPLTGIRGGAWLDLGHLNTFFRSRATMTTQRAFNEMSISTRMVTKSSDWTKKVEAEARWFRELPEHLRIYLPHLVRAPASESSADSHAEQAATSTGYSLEYLYLLPLSDLSVYGRLPGPAWRHVFRSCREVLKAFRAASTEAPSSLDALDRLYLPKTRERLTTFAEGGFDVDSPLSLGDVALPSLMDIATDAARDIRPATAADYAIVHGDFCFSNILHDTRVQSIRLIDPRGLDADGTPTIYGDARYDVAKLYHSVIGRYDLLIADRFRLEVDGPRYELTFDDDARLREVARSFREVFFAEEPDRETEVLAMTIHLFLSMLPLHADHPHRQQAMVANALRLYLSLVERRTHQ